LNQPHRSTSHQRLDNRSVTLLDHRCVRHARFLRRPTISRSRAASVPLPPPQARLSLGRSSRGANAADAAGSATAGQEDHRADDVAYELGAPCRRLLRMGGQRPRDHRAA
jgi:hypothetical protein